MLKNKKIIVGFFLLFFIISIFSLTMINADLIEHKCVGEECKFCYGISLLKRIFDVILNLSVFYIIVKENRKSVSKINKTCIVKNKLSLVELKVKLSE